MDSQTDCFLTDRFVSENRHLSFNIGDTKYFEANFLHFVREKQMHASRLFLAISALVFCSLLAMAQDLPPGIDLPAEKPTGSVPSSKSAVNPELSGPAGSAASTAPAAQPGRLFSPSVAKRFYDIAYELANSKDITESQAEQAIVFLSAVLNLDTGADYAVPVLIKCACRQAQGDYSALVSRLLAKYLDESADIEVAREAVRYLLDRLDSREQREKFLEQMLRDFGNKNAVMGSELATMLGLLLAEKPDLEGAQFYLVQAYNHNQYNKVAFAKLAEIVPEQLTPVIYIRQLKVTLRENPSDIQAALSFAQYAERLELYETAALAYEYCANLFAYLYPSDPLPSDIYLPWAISCYNTQPSRPRCLQIADTVRKSGRFDLLLEAVAGKAADKIGDAEQASRIFKTAEDKAQQLLVKGPKLITERLEDVAQGDSQKVGAKEFAWFYCFALPDPAKALDWANKSYATEPNSASTAAILAYALVLNDQTEWAKPLLNAYERNQIADLALVKIQLKEGQKDLAVETLKSLIAKDPGSLAAEQAREILTQQGAAYVPQFDPAVILAAMEKNFGETLVPTFVSPDKLISVQFNARGNKISYGSNLDATVAITNNSSEPLVISDDGLFRGNIRVDADVTGDLKKKIPNLVSLKVRTALFLEPGRALLVPVPLVTGQIGRLLFAHPQASLDMAFTLYLDPVITDGGKIANRLSYITPARIVVKRPAIEITGKYLRSRFNSISTGQLGQKIQTAQLFVGLLMEQQAMSGRKPLYRFVYADWMPTMLKSGLIHEAGLLRNPADGEWVVKVNTMADMLYLPLDHDLSGAVAESINARNWPVRMMALYLLAKNRQADFGKVLNWVAKYDPHPLVRNMAVALGGTASKQPVQPEQPSLQLPTVEETPAEPLK
jgi:tetratricopeptide (TPR) repeat protein